ncbi:MAG: hypothetical protein ACFFCV_16420, partial [Promethearchaeota archaeon]
MKIINFIKLRIHLLFLLISVSSLIFIYLNYINIKSYAWISKNTFILILLQLTINSSAVFAVLFLPTYPIFFLLMKNKNYHFREILGISIVSNSSFFIIAGFIGSWIKISITFEYFFFLTIVTYFSLILITIFRDLRRSTSSIFKKVQIVEIKDGFKSIFKLFHKFGFTSGLLLIIFITLFCILNLVNTSFFAGTDVWLHLSLVRYIKELNVIPIDQYYGAFGLHIFGVVIYYFSGINLIILPKCFIFYTVPLCSLIFYNIFMRIFKNKNLAILGVFLLVSSFGFSWYMMVQFWPSAITLIQGLVLFSLFYIRLQGFLEENVPEREDISSNILSFYILSIFIFISSLLTHSLLIMIIITSYLWLYLIYFTKNYRRGFDLILILTFFSIFFIFYFFNISTGYFQVFDPFKLIPWYYFLFGSLGFAFIVVLILLRYRKLMDFSKGKYKSIITGKNKKFYKIIENKIIFPLIFFLTFFLSIVFTLFNIAVMNIFTTYIIYFIEMLLISSFAVWGIFLFRYKPRGKPLFIWGLALDTLFFLIFLYDAIIGFTTFFLRVYFITT